MAKKSNGKACEAIYDDDTLKHNDEQVAALETARTDGAGEFRGRQITRVDPEAADWEAATIVLRDDAEILCVSLPNPGREPAHKWYACARFDQKEIGSHEFLVARRFQFPFTGAHLAALETAFGRDGFSAYARDNLVAKRVELESAARWRLSTHQEASFARYHGLWFLVTRTHHGERVRPAPVPQPEYRMI